MSSLSTITENREEDADAKRPNKRSEQCRGNRLQNPPHKYITDSRQTANEPKYGEHNKNVQRQSERYIPQARAPSALGRLQYSSNDRRHAYKPIIFNDRNNSFSRDSLDGFVRHPDHHAGECCDRRDDRRVSTLELSRRGTLVIVLATQISTRLLREDCVTYLLCVA